MKTKKKKIRLKLHVEMELLGTRVTPSPRRRDPILADQRRTHILTARQRDLWRAVFGTGCDGGCYFAKRFTAEQVADRVKRKAAGDVRIAVVETHAGVYLAVEQILETHEPQ